jgi:hypothetical protein
MGEPRLRRLDVVVNDLRELKVKIRQFANNRGECTANIKEAMVLTKPTTREYVRIYTQRYRVSAIYDNRVVEPEEMAVPRQRIDKHVPAATKTRNNRRTIGRGVFYAVQLSDNNTI